MTRCEPEVLGRQALEAKLLGARRDFAGFVRAMRVEFVRLAAAAAAAAAAVEEEAEAAVGAEA